ncbi:hypothetical protein BDZ97DRAFT_176945 [Flammula alnicola]|nr:hypothetical protein BDZ97DRAFT_176945 [Flammula alnicola]
MNGQSALKSTPASPSIPRFRPQSTPIIAAPRPRRISAIRNAILSYRSGLSLEYEIEHYQAPEPVAELDTSNDRPVPPVPAAAPSPPPLQPVRQSTQQQQPVFSTPFYHSAVQTAIEDQPQHRPQPPPPAQLGQIRRLPPSPPPLGDWPRLDATSRPRTKRKPLPHPLPEPEPEPQPQIPLRSQPLPQPRRQSWQLPPPSQPQPQPQPRPQPHPVSQSSLHALDAHAAALTAALQPLASQSTSWRSKPSGPRRRSSSIDDNRPPHLDLSNISSFRSPGFGP